MKDREHAADPIDRAQQTSEQFLEADIANARANSAPEQHPDFDGEHCVEEDCGAALPAARLAMRRVRCVECQQRKESKQRRKL